VKGHVAMGKAKNCLEFKVWGKQGNTSKYKLSLIESCMNCPQQVPSLSGPS
jgi:hypothetical protein